MTKSTNRVAPAWRHSGYRRRQEDFDGVIESSPEAFHSFFVPEPVLLFGDNRASVDPRTGIAEHGPADFTSAKRIVRIAVIGTPEGVDQFKAYLDRARRLIEPGRNAGGGFFDSIAFPDFPGATQDTAFRCDFVADRSMVRTVHPELFDRAAAEPNPSTRLQNVTELVMKELGTLADTEPAPHVVALLMPDSVERTCATIGAPMRTGKVVLTAGQKITRKLERERTRTGQDFLPLTFEDPFLEAQRAYWNLHNALKAHAMRWGLPTQMVWQSTLSGDGTTQDPASTAWNLFTALYYKADNIPWKLQHVPPNTCFVGICFYKENPRSDADMQTSLAQVFSGAGEGLVLKGQKAVVDRKRDRRAHLDERGAEVLLRQAIGLYEDHHHGAPNRVVVHKTSRFWPEELRGLKKALGSIYRYDFLTLEQSTHRFLRMGKQPPLRGMVTLLEPRHYLLYTTGYVPYLKTYPGMHVPVPLEVLEHHGDGTAEEVCSEILALTKVNWNSSFCYGSEPITVRFARQVGRILTEIPRDVTPKTKYKFYM